MLHNGLNDCLVRELLYRLFGDELSLVSDTQIEYSTKHVTVYAYSTTDHDLFDKYTKLAEEIGFRAARPDGHRGPLLLIKYSGNKDENIVYEFPYPGLRDRLKCVINRLAGKHQHMAHAFS